MVHRPADSRLLTNLLKQEKDSLNTLHSSTDASQVSLSALQAYASACSPPTSHVIAHVTNHLSTANEALRKYAVALDDWRCRLQSLKELEDEVATVMRDREILVSRLIKASKSKSQHDLPSTTLSPTFSKLQEAQAELQGCEAHLASKEHELADARLDVIRDGLKRRCLALVECAGVWGEVGHEGAAVLENFDLSSPNGHIPHSPFFKPLPNPASPDFGGSDVSSILPSHSASQLALPSAILVGPYHHAGIPQSKSAPAAVQHQNQNNMQRHQEESSSDDGDVISPENLEVHENENLPFSLRSPPDQKRKKKLGQSELGTRSSYTPRQREEERKVRKRSDSSFFGGIANLFKGRGRKTSQRQEQSYYGGRATDQDSDDEEPTPNLNYAAMKKRSTVMASSPSPNNAAGSGSMRLQKKGRSVSTSAGVGVAAKPDWANDSLVLMKGSGKGPVSPNATIRASAPPAPRSALGRMESVSVGKARGKNVVARPMSEADAGADEPIPISGTTATVTRSNTVKSDSSKASRHSRTRSLDGGSGKRMVAFGSGQPSLLTVVEGVSPTQPLRDMWGNEKPQTQMREAKAPGSVLDQIELTPPELNGVGAGPPRPSERERPPSSSGSSNPSHTNPSPMAASAIPASKLTSAEAPTSLLSPNSSISKRGTRLPLKSALKSPSRSRTPSPSETPRAKRLIQTEGHRASPLYQQNGDNDGDDSASTISAYETGQEDMSDEEEEKGEKAPTPPSKSPVITNPVEIEHNVPTDPDTASSASTETGHPTRRKSVRMSLNPTFSPTPPAFDDDPKSPWGGSSPNAKASRINPRTGNDAWQDSSDDDSDDYSKAKKALNRISSSAGKVKRKIVS